MAEKSVEKDLESCEVDLVMKSRQYPKVQMKQARTPTTPAVSVSQHITSEVVECSPEV